MPARWRSVVVVAALAVSACAAARAARPAPWPDPRARFAGFDGTCDGIPGTLPEAYVSGEYGALTAAQKRGMCTWYLWPGGDALSGRGADAEGNPRFWRRVEALTAQLAHQSSLAVNLTWLGFLDSRGRDKRFRTTGVVNDPDCTTADAPDAFGLWLDRCRDPYSSGVLGIRLYPNRRFDPARWDAARFFADGTIEPPYLAGLTCGICHIAFNPIRPPADPEHPQWKNIVGALGNQYLREGQVFKGRLPPDHFLYQLYETQPPGTSDTSRLSTDFVNNPGAINGIFFLTSHRPTEAEVMPDGATREVPHVLKDGADSIGGIEAALRVYVNIGTCGDYRMGLEETLVGLRPQRPFERAHAEAACEDWRLTAARMPDAAAFLDAPVNAAYRLADAPGAEGRPPLGGAALALGQRAFAESCARCHSSKKPPGLTEETKHDPSAEAAWVALVQRPDFLEGNFLSDDRRYPVVSANKRLEIGTNAARAVATNALEGHLWQDFSSRTYKTLPSPGTLFLYNPYDAATPIVFPVPAGRGYYRTPSLVALWTSAPFLHNNALGRYTGDPSVEGRRRAFRDAAEKLLWPERRDGVKSIKVTTGPTFLKVRDRRVEVPAGTPVNLLAHVDPRAAEIRHVGAELLPYNQCPDFVEDRGHLFGAGLSEPEKAALIAYMETF